MALMSPEVLAAAMAPAGRSLLATAMIAPTIDDCIVTGCYGMPPGLPGLCYDPDNIESFGPPVVHKRGLGLICALFAGGTEEGQRLIREAEQRRAAARTATTAAARTGSVPYQDSRSRLIQLCRPREASWNVRSTKRKYNDATGYPGAALFGTSYDVIPNPTNTRCYIFQTEAFELQKNLARMLKQQLVARRTTMGYLEAINFAMQASSCAAMTVNALNINPNTAWLRWFELNRPTPPLRPTGVPAWPRFRPLFGFEYIQGNFLDEALTMTNWPGTVAGPSIAGESYANPGGGAADIILPHWAARPGDMIQPRQPITLSGEWLNGRNLSTKRANMKQRALDIINFQPNLRDSVLVEAELWVDWVLNLPTYSQIMRGYIEEWVKSATTFGPSNPYGFTPPISAVDYKAVGDGTQAMNDTLALAAITGVAALGVGVGTLNPKLVISGLAAIVGSLLTEAPRLSSIARVIQMPFTRWVADPGYSLDVAGPATAAMMTRVVGAMVRYQNDLGIDFGIAAESGGGVRAAPQDLPRIEFEPPPPPPPPEGMSKFAKIALIGGAGLGALALARYLMK